METIGEVSERVRNGIGWVSVVTSLTSGLNKAVDNLGAHVDCPFPHRHRRNGGQSDFRLFDDFDETGRAICTCHPSGVGVIELLLDLDVAPNVGYLAKKIRELVDGGTVKPVQYERPTVKEDVSAKIEAKAKRLAKLKSQLLPLDHPQSEPMRKYYATRGLNIKSTESKFHPGLAYYVVDKDEKTGFKKLGTYPCIVSFIKNVKNEDVVEHRIFITSDGDKAPVPKPKKLGSTAYRSETSGCAIRARESDQTTLHICEGVEVAEALKLTMPAERIWSAPFAVLLGHVEIPTGVKKVVIWADLDHVNPHTGRAPGLAGAQDLKHRLEAMGIQVIIMLPAGDIPENAKSVDWEDVIVQARIFDLPVEARKARLVSYAVPYRDERLAA